MADFIGSTNLLELGVDAAGRATVLGEAIPGLAMPPGTKKAAVSIRPEDVRLGLPGSGRIAGTVSFVRDLGGTIETYVDAHGATIVAVATPRERPDVGPGDSVGILLPPESCVVVETR